jgi:integrase
MQATRGLSAHRLGEVNVAFINRVFVKALTKAGIADFSWHDLRHTFASRLAMARVDSGRLKSSWGTSPWR